MTVVAGFRVESLVGQGAMGEVYRAVDQDGNVVALKLLDSRLAHDERFRQRFLRESQIAAGLDHPNIVPTISSGEDDGRLYLAMQYIEGEDLRDLLRREGRLEPDGRVDLVGQVAACPRHRTPRRARPPRRQARQHPAQLGRRKRPSSATSGSPATSPPSRA